MWDGERQEGGMPKDLQNKSFQNGKFCAVGETWGALQSHHFLCKKKRAHQV